jgi:uncharacterized protein (TIGR02757 family)
MILDKNKIEKLYENYNLRKYVIPDPLQFLYSYEVIADRAIVGLIASGLAYGRVAQILISIEKVLNIMGASPSEYIQKNTICEFRKDLDGFKHRFTTGEDVALFLNGIKHTISEFGSLYQCFSSFLSHNDDNIIPALTLFADKLTQYFDDKRSYLFPSPAKGSACKRPMLFLRWMIRKDLVDIGGWDDISASKLIIPVDTHMHQFSLKCGLTQRKNANLATAVEITDAFKKISPNDPVKYDFSITRFGIRNDMDVDDICVFQKN